jgi:flagellin-like hook-associated protein FlgL
MKNKLFYGVITLGVILLTATACQKVPQAQLDRAQTALDSARIAQADRYLPAEFNALQDSFNNAVSLIEQMKSGSFLKRNYKEAASKLESVKLNADVVIADAAVRKEQVKNEAEGLIEEVNALITEVKDLVVKAPKGKEGKAALEAIQQDITVIESTVAEASGMFSQGDYLSSKDKLAATKEKALSIKAELQAAIDKVKR